MMNEIKNIKLDEKTYVDMARIFTMMPPSLLKKINIKFIQFINEKAMKSNEISSINPYIPLNEQELSDEVKVILGIIYKEYLNEEKENTEFNENREEKINNKDNIEIDNNKDNLQLVVQKEGIISKILNKIKSLFRKN